MNATFDETIERIEQLYLVLTGNRPPAANGHKTPIPPEVDPIVHVQEQLGRMVEAFQGVLPQEPAWMPRASMFQDGEETVIVVDLPGIRRDQVQIRVAPDAIVVTGRRPRPQGMIACDVPFGPFMRSFPLTARVAPERVAARLADGVLTIRLHAGARPKSSEVSIMS